MIVFLYFLLICNSLSNDIKENTSEEENKSITKNINEEETLNIENILDNLEEYLSKDLSSENIFLSLCCPINYMDFSDSINMVTYLTFFFE